MSAPCFTPPSPAHTVVRLLHAHQVAWRHLARVSWQPPDHILDKVNAPVAKVALARAPCPSRLYPRDLARHAPALISRALTQPNSCCAAVPRSCTGALAHAAAVAVVARGASDSATVFACPIRRVAS